MDALWGTLDLLPARHTPKKPRPPWDGPRGTGDTLNYREMDKHIRPGHERANSLYTRCRCPHRPPPPDDELQIDIIAKYFQSDYFTPVGKSIIITISLKSHLNVHTAERSMSWVCACARTGCQWGSVGAGVGGRCDWMVGERIKHKRGQFNPCFTICGLWTGNAVFQWSWFFIYCCKVWSKQALLSRL